MTFQQVLLLSTAAVLVQVGSATALVQPNIDCPTSPDAIESLIAQAPPTDDKARETPEPPWARGLNLNLTADQRSRLRSVNEKARKEGEALHLKLVEAEKKMLGMLQSSASIDQLRQQHQEVQKLHQQRDNSRFETLMGERQVLTPDQLAKVIQKFKGKS